MNILSKVALQGLRKNRTRTLVTIVGVALSAALITGVITFGVSLLDYMTRGAIAKYGDWHAAFFDVDAGFVEAQKERGDVAYVAAFQNVGYAVLDGGQNPDKPYVFIAGIEEETAQALRIELLAGRLPQAYDEIVVPSHLITNGGVQVSVGDTLTLAVGERKSADRTLGQHDAYAYEEEQLCATEEKTYTVVGVCLRPHFEARIAPGYTLITKANPSAPGERLSAFVTLDSPYAVRAYAYSAAGEGGYALNEEVLRFAGLSSDRLFTTLLLSVGAMVIAIIMTGSVFLIYNAFSISLSERTQQFGVLMSVGATAKQLRHSVLFEGLSIGAVGIPIGVLLGLGGMGTVISAVARSFGGVLYADVPMTLVISLPAIACAAVISLATILISAYIPAGKAAGMPVMACIRQTRDVRVDAKDVRTPRFAARIIGLEGTLALKNFRRNKSRCRSIVLSLVLSVVLFISSSAFVQELQRTAEQTKVFTTYDIGVSAPDMDDGQMPLLHDMLKTADGVTESGYQAAALYTTSVRAGDLSAAYWQGETPLSSDEPVELSVQVRFLDEATYRRILDGLNLQAYTGEGKQLLACAVTPPDDEGLHTVGDLDGMFVRPSMEMTLWDGERAIGVQMDFAAFVPPDILPSMEQLPAAPYSFCAIAPYSQKDAYVTAETKLISKGFTFSSDTPSQTAGEIERRINSAGLSGRCTLYNVHEMLDESRSMIFIVNVFAYTFIVMISLIAAANVFNTISTNIRLHRRELAMLRSVGMSQRAFQRMMNMECALYGLNALGYGLPAALLCCWLIHRGMLAADAENLAFALPWGSIGVSVLSVLLVIFAAMTYAVGRIRRENVIDALRDETL